MSPTRSILKLVFLTSCVTLIFTVLLLAAPAGTPEANSAGPESGQELKDMTLEQLADVVVTSPSKEPRSALKSPVAIYVITADDIRRSGVQTIPDALRLAPGVEVAQIDSSKWSVGIRGFGSRLNRSVLVLIDGRSVYTPLFAGTYWEVQDTLLEDIDRIEVIRGPGGTIWGPNAVNGVINIITKSSRDTQGFYATSGGGDQQKGFFGARYGGSHGNGFTYRAYAKGFDRDPDLHPDGDNFDAWRGVQGGFRMDWGGPRNSFTLQGDGYGQKDGEQVSVTNYNPAMTINAQDGFERLSGANLVFKWNRAFSEGNNVQVEAYYDRTNRLEPNLGEDRDTFDVDYLERSKLGSRNQLLYGAGGRLSDGRFDEVTSGLVFFPFHRLDTLFSGFIEDDITVNNKLMLFAGTKLLNTNYTHGVDFQPSGRLMWTPTNRQTFWASFTHALRTPSDAEEDFYLSSYLESIAGFPVFARFNANPNFAPEQLNATEAGYRVLFGKNVFMDVDGYFNHYHDLFSEDVIDAFSLQSTLPYPTATPSPVYILLPAQFQNGLFGATYGVEMGPEWQPTKFWRLRGTYSFLRMSIKQSPVPAGEISEGPGSDNGSSPQHQVTLDSSFDMLKRLQLDLIYRYVSSLTAQSVNGYSTGDVRVGYRIGRNFEFSLAGQNLFQPGHVEYIGDPSGPVAVRRTAYASLSWNVRSESRPGRSSKTDSGQ